MLCYISNRHPLGLYLYTLRLGVNSEEYGGRNTRLASPFHCTTNKCCSPNLTECFLESIDTRVNDMKRFLSSHSKSLLFLYLTHLHLYNGSYLSLLTHIRDMRRILRLSVSHLYEHTEEASVVCFVVDLYSTMYKLEALEKAYLTADITMVKETETEETTSMDVLY